MTISESIEIKPKSRLEQIEIATTIDKLHKLLGKNIFFVSEQYGQTVFPIYNEDGKTTDAVMVYHRINVPDEEWKLILEHSNEIKGENK